MASTKEGKIIKSLSLYAGETLALLQTACSNIELKGGDEESSLEPAIQPGTSSRYIDDDSSSDDDGEESGDEDNSSSADESNGENPLEGVDEEEPLANVDTSSPTQAQTQTQTAAQRAKTIARKPSRSKNNHSQQEMNRISANLVKTSIPLDRESTILLPSALLEKEILRPGSSLLSKCRSFVKLTEAVGGLKRPAIVLLLRSGKFAGGVFEGGKCTVHRACQRYTVRKGQGKAQSSQDGKRRPKSMGAQLRRAGEQGLKEDIHSTILDWKHHFKNAALILVSCPKTMRHNLFASSGGVDGMLSRDDNRVRKIPMDVGRPTYESVCLVHDVLTNLVIREVILSEDIVNTQSTEKNTEKRVDSTEKKVAEPEKIVLPLSDLHGAAKEGKLASILDILQKQEDGSAIDLLAGFDFMTPLHFAAESTPKVDPVTSAACVSSLLIQGRADPCALDARHRVPYFLASHDKVREAFRKARAVLGEDYCDWEKAKVGPPLTDEDLRARKEKEAEKNRKKKARQKEKKAREKAQAEELRQREQEEKERQKRAEDAKRIRDSLKPKTTNAGNICDFCQAECNGKRRQQMFKRLEYVYCSTDCVQKHKRELMAAAAMARFGS